MRKHPTLIVICGFAGSGKTTLSNRLAQHFAYPVFNVDLMGDSLSRQLGSDSPQDLRRLAFDSLCDQVEWQLAKNLTVILDCDMGQPRHWDRLDAMARRFPLLRTLPLRLKLDFDECRARVVAREAEAGRSLVNAAQLDDYKDEHAFLESLKVPRLLEIDARQQPDVVFRAAVASIYANLLR